MEILRKIKVRSSKKGLIDICILTCRRLEFTKIVFERLLKNTDFDLVGRILIVHDFPDQENTEFLESQIEELKKFNVDIIYVETNNRAVVPGMKFGMEKSISKYFLKIDNDIVPGAGWVNRLVDCMESYPELVLLGYTRIWLDDFPKEEKIVMKDGLDYGYLKCYDNSQRGWKYKEQYKDKIDMEPIYLRVHVGGSMVMRMEPVRPTIKHFRSKGKYLGWTDYQFSYIKPLGTSGWYYPNIEGTLYLDKLGDRSYFDKVGLPYDELCKLLIKYKKQGLTKVNPETAFKNNELKSLPIEGRVFSG